MDAGTAAAAAAAAVTEAAAGAAAESLLAPEECRACGSTHLVASTHYPVSPQLLDIGGSAGHRLAAVQQHLSSNLQDPPASGVRMT